MRLILLVVARFAVVGLLMPLPSAAQDVPGAPLNVDVPGIVEVVWRDVVDQHGAPSRVPVFYRATPEDHTLAVQVVKVDEAFRGAKLRNDVDTLRRVLRDEFFQINQNGNGRDKEQMLELWSTFPVHALITDRATIRFSGNNAVVTGQQIEVNASGTDRMLFTRVYVQDPAGEWQLLSSTQFRNPHAHTRAESPPDSRIHPPVP